METYRCVCDKCGLLGGEFMSRWDAEGILRPKGWLVSSDVLCPEHRATAPKIDDAFPLGETQSPTAEQLAAYARAADERMKELDEDQRS